MTDIWCSIELQVSVAAMKSFQIIVNPQATSTSVSPSSSLATPTAATPTSDPSLSGELKLPSQLSAELSTSGVRGTEQVSGTVGSKLYLLKIICELFSI